MRKNSIDKYTVRGVVFIAISVLGLVYEFIFADSIRSLVVIAYVFVIGIGLICIFQLKETE